MELGLVVRVLLVDCEAVPTDPLWRVTEIQRRRRVAGRRALRLRRRPLPRAPRGARGHRRRVTHVTSVPGHSSGWLGSLCIFDGARVVLVRPASVEPVLTP